MLLYVKNVNMLYGIIHILMDFTAQIAEILFLFKKK